jgi:rSAM/selenodomain-associated transferase 1
MIYKFPDTVLMIFCKAPVAGQVKTRLTPELSAGDAARLYIELSERTMQIATEKRLCPVQLWCAPSTDHDFFANSAATYRLQLRQQQGADLGERMNHAFAVALAEYSHAIIIGCDCPSLTGCDLDIAISALNTGCDIVLAPAEDGGYVLIGLNRPVPELFENMPWGTAEVLNQTRTRIGQTGQRCFELKEQWDVDTFDDLLRYRKIAGNTA